MPRRAALCLTKRAYPPFSRRRWYPVRIDRVCRPKSGRIRFSLSVLGDEQQADRILTHELPAVLAPGSPLDRLLAATLGAVLEENQSVDLVALIGRELEARFTAVDGDGVQMIAETRPSPKAHHGTAAPNRPAAKEERT